MVELVIKIDEKLVEWIDKYFNEIKGFNGKKIGMVVDAIKNGKPIPKGHGRLIDADKLQTEMDKDVRRAMSFVDLKDFVWLAPTIVEADRQKVRNKE